MKKPLGTALLLAVLAGTAQAGDITGTITLGSAPGARKQGQTRAKYDDKDHSGDQVPNSESEVENVVIYLEGKGLKCTPVTKMGSGNTFDQKNKEFLPHVLPIAKGSKVFFKNKDPFPHHVYSVSNPGNFEIMKHGSTVRSHDFDGSGEVEIFCGIHTKMNAYLLVVDTDYFCKPGADGKYRLGAVPAGDYALMVWHPRLPKPEKRMITVPASGPLKLDLKL
ncbi:methylamine utilization protein [bacterium]|nr:methylamine utilization protein [bacterium]